MTDRKETIHVQDLVTGYIGKHGRVAVTDSVSDSLYSGELTCLIGPNGAGKSTLLKTLSGFIPPLSGKVIVEGSDLRDYTDSRLAKIIGIVLTERINLNNMSVYELVAMGRSPYTGFWGRLDTHDKDIVDEAMSLVKIDNLRDRMADTLSDGERQKVMIAKALAQETPIIFLDEPTAFLDYPSKVEILQLLQNLSRAKQKTVFLSTHDLELALQIADKIWLIDRPHGVTTGIPEDLAANGLLSEYFKRDGICFDVASGLFRIAHRLDREMGVEGDESRFNLLSKALARNGIKALRDGNAEDKILITPTGYLFNNDPQELPTIELLLNRLLK